MGNTAGPSLKALRSMAEQMRRISDLETAQLPKIEGVSEFAAQQLARFVEQAKQLRQEIENPVMPSFSDSESEDEDGASVDAEGADLDKDASALGAQADAG